MCEHSRYIFNPYSRRKVLVKCGKCPACQQEKACARANRIRNNVTSGTIALFVTLTYSNDYVPYIKKSDLQSDSLDIPVYRNCTCRLTFSRSHGYKFKKSSDIELVDNVYIPVEYRCDSSIFKLQHLKGLPSDHVGVCLYSDFQNFIKRLRITLQRRYNYEKSFSYFSCSEYGAHTFRPHFHTLIFIPTHDEEKFRDAIASSWSYADYYRTQKSVEIARDAASYVSSYVNGHIDLSSPLQVPQFKTSHSYSKHFGLVLDCFQLSSILDKIDRRDLYYYCRKQYDGESAVTALPIPTYVLNRWFPKFKGFGRLSSDALERLLLDPSSAGFELQSGFQPVCYTTKGITFKSVLNHEAIQDNPLYTFTPLETYQIFVRLDNAYRKFHAESGLSRFDYVYYYCLAWQLHFSTVLKDSYANIEQIEDFSDFYENAVELVSGCVSAPTLPSNLDFQLSPDFRLDVREKHLHMLDVYNKLDKSKKVVNYCMSHQGYYV